MFGLIWWIIVGLIAGWLTGKIMSGGGYGPLMDIIVGILGALAGAGSNVTVVDRTEPDCGT